MPTDPSVRAATDPSVDDPGRPAVVVLEPVRDLTREVAAVVLLTVGSLLPLVGWLVGAPLLVGSVLLVVAASRRRVELARRARLLARSA